jgi:hypothetical protein
MKKKASTLTFLALTCLSCNPLVVDTSDAGVNDAGTTGDAGTETSFVFEPQKITIAAATAR